MNDTELEVVQEFLVESYENLDRLDREFLTLEENPSDNATLASVFRTIHTIKGTCGFLGFGKLEKVSHVGESLLSRLRDGQLTLTPAITSGLLAMVDAIRQILSEIEHTQQEGNGDYRSLIAALTDLTGGVEPPKPLGQILVDTGRITPEAAENAVARQNQGDPRHVGEILVEEGQIEPQEVVAALNAQAEQRAGLAESNIRVDVALLDKLMNLVGELVLTRNQVIQFTSRQKDSALAGASQRLNLITSELQEGVMKTRMQPIGNIWSKLPRVVRDLAMACGKQIRVDMEGRETELDKTIIEAIKDPLTHLVRNCADHGIERPPVRIAAGKPAEGRMYLRAFHEGGQVNIEIADDGAGIDAEKIKNKALQNKLITPDQAARMSDREALQLIFLPGLSTADKITNVSGRGVGMDVVRTNIEKIGGTIDLHSRKGEGTTVLMKIPLTLAIIPALIVTSGAERFAIPQVSLLELMRLNGEQAAKQLEMVHGAPVFRLRGNLLPLVNLAEVMGGEPPSAADGVNIVVLQAGDRSFGLIVNGINDTEEIVVKPLGKELKGVAVFAGATIMGDGAVALILDVTGLAQFAGVIAENRERSRNEAVKEQGERAAERETLLLFRVGQDGRMAIPLSLVGRLEELETKLIEKSGEQDVVQYRGQIMPLVYLSRQLGCSGSDETSATMQVVVHSHHGRSVGLVVDNIIDIVEEHIKIRRNTRREGLLGSAVIQDRVTDLVDIEAIVRSAAGYEDGGEQGD